jgi:hypothetical protein
VKAEAHMPDFLFQDSWMYHLTVVSGGGPNAGTQYEQLVQKLMETDGDPSELLLFFLGGCVLLQQSTMYHYPNIIVVMINILKLKVTPYLIMNLM